MKSFLSFVFLVSVFILTAQDKFGDRIYFGGGGGFSTGSNQTNISIFPQVGYKITDRYSAGIGITYQYVKIKQPSFKLSNYGWSVFNRFNVTNQFFAYAEFERLNFEYPISTERTERSSFNSLLVGAGYSEQLGGRASFSIMALYNVLYDESEIPRPYNSPWVIRAGVGVGIF
ncbi:MAG: hypothetical protein RLN88_00610 [Ekhidna sp.]|uniref:hypothetical protein n=1 Tax=Ekhidna sp. TaxID=2608089 RepID=UPI0032ED9F5D